MACLGVTDADWRQLAQEALKALSLDVARKAYMRLRDTRYIDLISRMEVERRQANHDDQVLMATVLAYQGKLQEAARLYCKANRVERAIDMFSDLRKWEEARQYAHTATAEHAQELVRRQAQWAEETGDQQSAYQTYLAAGETMKAIHILGRARAAHAHAPTCTLRMPTRPRVHMPTCPHARVPTCPHAHTHMPTRPRAHAHVHMPTCPRAHASAHVHMHMPACLHAHMPTCPRARAHVPTCAGGKGWVEQLAEVSKGLDPKSQAAELRACLAYLDKAAKEQRAQEPPPSMSMGAAMKVAGFMGKLKKAASVQLPAAVGHAKEVRARAFALPPSRVHCPPRRRASRPRPPSARRMRPVAASRPVSGAAQAGGRRGAAQPARRLSAVGPGAQAHR